MVSWDDYREQLLAIRAEWDKAEADIKLAEQVSNKIVLPSIKELRYAGRQLIEVLTKISGGAPKEDVDSLVHDALFDCLRARHDAIDAASSKIAIDLELMLRKLGYDVVLRVYPSFAALVQELTDLRDKIVASRGNREKRTVIYELIKSTDLPGLVKKYRQLMASEPIMKKIAVRERRFMVLNYGIGIAGLLMGAAAVIVAIVH